jgi:hypothetical protein
MLTWQKPFAYSEVEDGDRLLGYAGGVLKTMVAASIVTTWPPFSRQLTGSHLKNCIKYGNHFHTISN